MILLVAIFILFILIPKYYVRRKYNFWKRQGILQINPTFPYGDTKGLILRTEYQGHAILRFYKYFKSRNAKYGGYYLGLKPYLTLIDLDLIRSILIKDFNHFTDKGWPCNDKVDPLAGHLIGLSGARWKHMRAKLTPTFTSSKMKMMFQTLVATSDGLQDLIEQTINKAKPVDIKDVLSRFGTDVIGSCAFGIECNSIKNPNTKFRIYGEMALNATGLDQFKRSVAMLFPKLSEKLNLRFFNKDISDFFLNTVKDTIRYREENNVKRNDFLQILLQMRDENNGKGGLTIGEITAQCFIFFMAGYETSSTTMSWCLLELTQHPDIQEKLRYEILETLKKNNGELTYESILGMQYMDQVINETLRYHPPVTSIVRKCTQDYQIPNSKHVLKKGQMIRFSVWGLHFDPDYYKEPETFMPERFAEEEKSKIPLCAFMPFGDGPRQCIGLRFGLMQVKVGLTVLLKNFRFKLNKKTKLPVTLDPAIHIQTVKGGIWLDAEKLVT